MKRYVERFSLIIILKTVFDGSVQKYEKKYRKRLRLFSKHFSAQNNAVMLRRGISVND